MIVIGIRSCDHTKACQMSISVLIVGAIIYIEGGTHLTPLEGDVLGTITLKDNGVFPSTFGAISSGATGHLQVEVHSLQKADMRGLGWQCEVLIPALRRRRTTRDCASELWICVVIIVGMIKGMTSGVVIVVASSTICSSSCRSSRCSTRL